MFKKNPLASAISSAAVASAMAATGVAVPSAAFGAEVIEEVVVTGSRIRRTDLEAVSPVSVVEQEEFTISGIMNVEQKLAELPQTLPSFGPSSNNPGDGTARVDLRGLGSFRTLVLVNGRRWIQATQTGVSDLNTIPASLVEQVDVVTGGASAVYGSDAVAGVVNFKLIEDFEGVEFGALYDVATEDSDADKKNFELTIGGNFDNGRGNAVVYGMYSDRDALFQGDRDFSEVALTEDDDLGRLVPGGSTGIPGTRDFTGVTVNPGLPNEFTLGRFNSDGTGAPFLDPEDRFNYAPDNYLQLPQDRWLLMGMAHYDLTDNARVYTELTTSNNEVPQELAPTPAFLGTLEINPDSPFFAPDVQAAYDGIRSDTNGDGVIDGDDNAFLDLIGRRMVENGPRQSGADRDAFRAMAGLTVDFTDTWTFDTFASRMELDEINTLNNDVSETRFRQAVLVTDDGLNCQLPINGCVPMNIFGEGNISQAAVSFVNVGAANVTEIKQTIFNATVTGDLGEWRIDDNNSIGLAFGYEYREEKSEFRPDEFLSSGDVLGFNAGEPTKGDYDVKEVFGEIDVPLLSDRTGVDYLGVWGAYRYSDYSNIGSVDSYAFNGTYAPISGLSFRAGYQRAVRAPNVQELFLGQANGFPTATDPCSADGAPDLGNAALVALCEATGVPAGLVGVFDQANTQIEGTFGGNPELDEETSDTVTVGVVYQPSWLDGFDITLDYYSIEIDDAIDVLGGGVNNVLDICYNQIGDINSPFCQAITGPTGLAAARRADGNVDTVRVLNENIAEIETEGVDLNANYVTPLDFGLFGAGGSTLSIQYRSNFLTKYEETPVIGLPTTFECEGNFGNFCGDPRPEYQHNMRFTWDTGPMTVSLLWRYLGESDDDRIDNDDTISSSDLIVDKIDDIHYIDIAGSWRFEGALEGLRLNIGVRNLFDEDPTEVGDVQEQANTFPETYDVIGRRVWVSATYSL